MLITTRMTLVLSQLTSSQKSSPSIYGVFVAAHFFNDKFNYARRVSRFIPPLLFPALDFFKTSDAATIFPVVIASL